MPRTPQGRCSGRRGVIRVRPELSVNPSEVGFDSVHAEGQAVGDRPIGQAFRSQGRYRPFARRQDLVAHDPQRPLANSRVKYAMPSGTSSASKEVTTARVSGRWAGLLIPM